MGNSLIVLPTMTHMNPSVGVVGAHLFLAEDREIRSSLPSGSAPS
jgi:hypothetical protein